MSKQCYKVEKYERGNLDRTNNCKNDKSSRRFEARNTMMHCDSKPPEERPTDEAPALDAAGAATMGKMQQMTMSLEPKRQEG